MTVWLGVTTAACAGLLLLGYLAGRLHARRIAARARGGMLHPATPRQVSDRWNFPQAPKLYDQDAVSDPDDLFANATDVPLASVGHPLVPSPMTGAAIPGSDPGACPYCGLWRRAGVAHNCEQMTDAAIRTMAAAMDATAAALDPHSRRVKP